MNDITVNSKEYWDERFTGDWQEYSGNEQTAFFAKLSCMLLPDWFRRIVTMNKYTICDVGCACGEGANILSQHLGVNVDGIDFSTEAVQIAQKKFPVLNFYQGDINSLPPECIYNIIYISNVLEHFFAPWEIAEKLSCHIKDYLVIQVPYNEKLDILEHVYKFENSKIPLEVNGFHLVYANCVDGRKVNNSLYPDLQILLIYSSHEEDLRAAYFSDLITGIAKIEYDLQDDKIKEKDITNDALTKTITENDDNIKALKDLLQKTESENVEGNIIREQLIKENEYLKNSLDQIVDQTNEDYEKLLLDFADEKRKAQEYEAQIVSINTRAETLEGTLNELLLQAKTQLVLKNKVIAKAEQQCVDMTESKLFKGAHFLYRLKYQGLKGRREERRRFRKWCFSKLTGNGGDSDRTYNPLYDIIKILTSNGESFVNEGTTQALDSIHSVSSEENVLLSDVPQKVSDVEADLSPEVVSILNQDYQKFDVIIFSVIDYDFRYQRPQHFATRFADNGHRVFYINANFKDNKKIHNVTPNLFIVDIKNEFHFNAIYNANWSNSIDKITQALDDLIVEFAIQDAVAIIDYPNWVISGIYMRERYGFKIVTDYMDDFTGFLDTTDDLVKEYCIRLLKESDLVVASSQFLYEIASNYNSNVGMIRNGTEFHHFSQANFPTENKRKIVGYYGAVAHWFDREKVCHLATNLPNCDIVIIGEITEGKEELEKFENIKLLGEIPYKKLPQYLKDFDVCLIPFDTSTDLIRATNPVKFYEYLSAGKKIVATEIPELEPYKNKYVYMSNDNNEFLKYVQICLDGIDDLADMKERITFAKSNDWQERYEEFKHLCKKSVPKVSVVVLTYNNLKLNKACIDSILSKTAYPNYELIIVDNQSTDGTIDWLKQLDNKHYANVKIIFNDRNSGFAGGNNVGLKSTKSDYYILLNNDTIVTRGWITTLVKHMNNNPKLGMCGPVTNSIGNEAKIICNYSNENELNQFAYINYFKNLSKEFKNVKVLALFCTIIKDEVIQKCGYLDENYNVGMFEDDDYSEAVKSLGLEIVIADDVFIHHFDGASFKKLENEKYLKIFNENKRLFEQKWGKTWTNHNYRTGVTNNSSVGCVLWRSIHDE